MYKTFRCNKEQVNSALFEQFNVFHRGTWGLGVYWSRGETTGNVGLWLGLGWVRLDDDSEDSSIIRIIQAAQSEHSILSRDLSAAPQAQRVIPPYICPPDALVRGSNATPHSSAALLWPR